MWLRLKIVYLFPYYLFKVKTGQKWVLREWVLKFWLGFGRQFFRLMKFAKKKGGNIEPRSKGSGEKMLEKIFLYGGHRMTFCAKVHQKAFIDEALAKKLLIIFAKSSILNVWLSLMCISAIYKLLFTPLVFWPIPKYITLLGISARNINANNDT